MTLVRERGDPGVIWGELDDVLLGHRVLGELSDLRRLDVDLVEVVLLVTGGVLGEDDALVVAAPCEAGAQRGRDLAVAHLPELLGAQIDHPELHAARLVPVEGDPITLPGDQGKEERGQAAELLERDARLTACFNGHGERPPPTRERRLLGA